MLTAFLSMNRLLVSPFEVMFGRAPTQLTPVMDVLELAETLDIIPFQGATRKEIASRVRARQDIVIKTMKRRWDTTNTIVCSSPQYIFLYFSNFLQGVQYWKQSIMLSTKTTQKKSWS
jgi:hypothetical protein